MKLYLVQHGLAVPAEKDPERSLSEEGKADVRRMAAHLKAKKIKADFIWHSGKRRAVQTAEIMGSYITHLTVEERDDVNPADPVAPFPDRIQELNRDLMLIGHLPFLQRLASLLLAGSDSLELISFTYSGVMCLEYTEKWEIAWFLTPDLI
ncbi:MAG: phosphohistidine phosphatase SixA [Candidatus Aureabacteria bacterium]|nr:phosphohistidine phosphatase SixA [Candidatus Auribacterota bacterium]